MADVVIRDLEKHPRLTVTLDALALQVHTLINNKEKLASLTTPRNGGSTLSTKPSFTKSTSRRAPKPIPSPTRKQTNLSSSKVSTNPNSQSPSIEVKAYDNSNNNNNKKTIVTSPDKIRKATLTDGLRKAFHVFKKRNKVLLKEEMALHASTDSNINTSQFEPDPNLTRPRCFSLDTIEIPGTSLSDRPRSRNRSNPLKYDRDLIFPSPSGIKLSTLRTETKLTN
eukprot:TRINITY_DN14752_c0_g1_i1.p1 TRINITY_DN14752_c0_g1~~TRINITY_DN14752_c0_g1_i1.p1  ORF type:complete len:225 (-),score=21.86 TRINITY_DN14752_c0_g1_i1:57-731(-)